MKYILFFILLPLFFCRAQVGNSQNFFPHKTGDMWEYRFFEMGDPVSWYDTLQSFIIFDSTDSKGIIHVTQYSRHINPIMYPDTTRYWIDTLNHYVYGRAINTDSTLIYKLNAQKGEKWIDTVNHIIVKVLDKWEDIIFSKQTTFMRIGYYLGGNIDDTLSWFAISENIRADGFGLIYSVGFESAGEINLIGAVINGIYYGDTTLVSVKDNKNFLPLSIKLYQNYPNPFNPSTTISFELSERSNISLVIYDVLGREIYKLIDNKQISAGSHYAVWNGVHQNGNKAASGIYFYRLVTNRQSLSHSMILLK